ncbi:hypothetical protein [Chromobacterium sphagni]|uniref:hypothetical protein n=1 Tax=Chromobacterium sphagni TaxID=1903179 RepID=UPI00111424DA|nr:hypothetical protein [Chromobacterium sphagni]
MPFLTDGEDGNANYFTLSSNEFHGGYVIDFTGESFPASAATKNLEIIKIYATAPKENREQTWFSRIAR